jgi:DNA-directed RNA polymerase beta' subunit
MRKVIFYFIIVAMAISVISCGGDKKATNMDELISKYDGKEFKNCDEMIEFGYEYIDVMIATIDRAAEGDEAALEDFDKMDEFFKQFDDQQKKLEEECPEKFEEFGKVAEEKMADSMEKLMTIMFGGTEDEMNFEEDMEWEEDIENYEEDTEWEEEVEEDAQEIVEEAEETVEEVIE